VKSEALHEVTIFRLAWIYRVFILIISAFVIVQMEKGDDRFIRNYPYWFLLYFSAGTLLYFKAVKDLPIFICLLCCDYIMVLMFQYFEPHHIFLEFLWLPSIFFAALVIVPFPFNIIIILTLGFPGIIFLSYGFTEKTSVLISGNSYPYYYTELCFFIPLMIFSVTAGFAFSQSRRMKSRMKNLEFLNRNFEKINRDISDRIFKLQYDTTQKERKRISKEIHDTAGYVFVNLIMMLQAASAVFYKDNKKAKSLIIEARDYAERGINEIRYILRNIREYTPVYLSLQNELFNISHSFEKATDVKVTIDYGNWPSSFSSIFDPFLTSFLQEVLTNALKHGQATKVSVICFTATSSITMIVSDNGKGAELPVRKGIGISSTEDFLMQYNGSFVISSGKDGFRIKIVLPFSGLSSKE
jgi:signal transduction histidine kinase